MAFTTVLSYSLLDSVNKRTSIRVHLPAAATVAQLQAFSDDFAAAIDGTTGCRVESALVTIPITLPGTLKAGADVDTVRQIGANLNYDAANTNYSFTLRIPGILPALREGDVVLSSDALIQAVTTLLEDGDGTLSPVDEYGNDITQLNGAAMSFWTK